MNMQGKNNPVRVPSEPAYLAAFRRCGLGDRVVVEPDPDHPEDMLALVAKVKGQTIGYIPSESWLVDAVHLDDKTVNAKIVAIEGDENGTASVFLKASVASYGRWAKYWHATY